MERCLFIPRVFRVREKAFITDYLPNGSIVAHRG